MKINYLFIRKIHLYACLSTVALFSMFIFTSYLMIHHDWFDRKPVKENTMVVLEQNRPAEFHWQQLLEHKHIRGRLHRENINQKGYPVREYTTATGSSIITLMHDINQAEVVHTTKSTVDAIVGIHRWRGYGGGLKYNIYAILLDLLGIGLLLFTITGVILWFKVLKNHRVAWYIFLGGLLYFAITMALLVYW